MLVLFPGAVGKYSEVSNSGEEGSVQLTEAGYSLSFQERTDQATAAIVKSREQWIRAHSPMPSSFQDSSKDATLSSMI